MERRRSEGGGVDDVGATAEAVDVVVSGASEFSLPRFGKN